MNKPISIVENIFFPKYCIICGKYGRQLCENCIQKKLQYLAIPYCPVCNGRLRRKQNIHKICKKRSALDGAISLLIFEKHIKKILWDYKYHHVYRLAVFLSRLLNERLATIPFSFDYIVPIPSHQRKINKRGYDHIALIAGNFEAKVEPLLIKPLHSNPQATLSRQARLINTIDTFILNKKISCRHKSILLFDDVITTGSTLQSAARVLKEAGAKRVYALTLAKDIRDFRSRGVK